MSHPRTSRGGRNPCVSDPAKQSTRSTKKKDQDAPRGLFRHPAGGRGIRFTCGSGHIHEEMVGPLKSGAVRDRASRRQRTYAERSWCPVRERAVANNLSSSSVEEETRILEVFAFEATEGGLDSWAGPGIVAARPSTSATSSPRGSGRLGFGS